MTNTTRPYILRERVALPKLHQDALCRLYGIRAESLDYCELVRLNARTANLLAKQGFLESLVRVGPRGGKQYTHCLTAAGRAMVQRIHDEAEGVTHNGEYLFTVDTLPWGALDGDACDENGKPLFEAYRESPMPSPLTETERAQEIGYEPDRSVTVTLEPHTNYGECFTILTNTLLDGEIIAFMETEDGSDLSKPATWATRAEAEAEITDADEDEVVACVLHADGSITIPDRMTTWTLAQVYAQRGEALPIDTTNPIVVQLREALEFAPKHANSVIGLYGWQLPENLFICAPCAARIFARGCTLPRPCEPLWDDQATTPCVTCGKLLEAR